MSTSSAAFANCADSPPDEAAGRWLDVLERLSVCARRLRRELAACTRRHDLSEAEFSLLWHCHRAMPSGVGQSELAAAAAVSAAQVSGLVEALGTRRLLEGCRDANDRRRQVWRITATGQAVLDALLADLQPMAHRLLPHWSDAADEAIGRLLADCGATTTTTCKEPAPTIPFPRQPTEASVCDRRIGRAGGER